MKMQISVTFVKKKKKKIIFLNIKNTMKSEIIVIIQGNIEVLYISYENIRK